jgi:hypothetical protein
MKNNNEVIRLKKLLHKLNILVKIDQTVGASSIFNEAFMKKFLVKNELKPLRSMDDFKDSNKFTNEDIINLKTNDKIELFDDTMTIEEKGSSGASSSIYDVKLEKNSDLSLVLRKTDYDDIFDVEEIIKEIKLSIKVANKNCAPKIYAYWIGNDENKRKMFKGKKAFGILLEKYDYNLDILSKKELEFQFTNYEKTVKYENSEYDKNYDRWIKINENILDLYKKLAEINYICTDLKLENMVVNFDKTDINKIPEIKLIDFDTMFCYNEIKYKNVERMGLMMFLLLSANAHYNLFYYKNQKPNMGHVESYIFYYVRYLSQQGRILSDIDFIYLEYLFSINLYDKEKKWYSINNSVNWYVKTENFWIFLLTAGVDPELLYLKYKSRKGFVINCENKGDCNEESNKNLKPLLYDKGKFLEFLLKPTNKQNYDYQINESDSDFDKIKVIRNDRTLSSKKKALEINYYPSEYTWIRCEESLKKEYNKYFSEDDINVQQCNIDDDDEFYNLIIKAQRIITYL